MRRNKNDRNMVVKIMASPGITCAARQEKLIYRRYNHFEVLLECNMAYINTSHDVMPVGSLRK